MFTLDDQRRGGSLMWSGSMIIDVIWLSIAVNDWMKSEVAKSKIIDAEIAQSIAAENKKQGSDV
jgi:cytochrome c oxidase assembly factor CtaG